MTKLVEWPVTLYSGTATLSGNTQSSSITTKWVKEAIFFLDITSASGTNPTLNITIQTYDSLTAKWYTLATFSQKTGVSQDVGYVEYGLGAKIAISYIVGGTNPSFTFKVTASMKDLC